MGRGDPASWSARQGCAAAPHPHRRPRGEERASRRWSGLRRVWGDALKNGRTPKSVDARNDALAHADDPAPIGAASPAEWPAHVVGEDPSHSSPTLMNGSFCRSLAVVGSKQRANRAEMQRVPKPARLMSGRRVCQRCGIPDGRTAAMPGSPNAREIKNLLPVSRVLDVCPFSRTAGGCAAVRRVRIWKSRAGGLRPPSCRSQP